MWSTDRAAIHSGLVDTLHGQHVINTRVKSHLVHNGDAGLLSAGVQVHRNKSGWNKLFATYLEEHDLKDINS